MRGTRSLETGTGFFPGIIPAYAGNTSAPLWAASAYRDHPRVCGEHYDGLRTTDLGWGSSPRMRGTRLCHFLACELDGIIPAYAGNTGRLIHSVCLFKDHPRVCGEHMSVHFYAGYWQGSSPRMRGTRRFRLWRDCRAGIIPAYAGNTPPKKS